MSTHFKPSRLTLRTWLHTWQPSSRMLADPGDPRVRQHPQRHSPYWSRSGVSTTCMDTFDEKDHPRGPQGKFRKKAGGGPTAGITHEGFANPYVTASGVELTDEQRTRMVNVYELDESQFRGDYEEASHNARAYRYWEDVRAGASTDTDGYSPGPRNTGGIGVVVPNASSYRRFNPSMVAAGGPPAPM